MKLLLGKVVDGQVVVESERLEEGASVTVLVEADEEPFDVTPEEKSALLEAMAQIRRGEFVSADEYLG